MRKFLIFNFCVICAVFGYSQRVQLLDTVQVGSMALPLQIKQTGRSITVVEAEQIKKLSVSSVDEILQTVAGVEVQSRSGFGTQADIVMRGSTFTQVLVLIDGMRLNDPLTGHFNGNIPVSVAEIARIEVLRGAASAIYGPDAVGGVINIITKTFDRSQTRELSGAIGYGEHNLVDANAGLFDRSGKVSFGAGVSVVQSDGESIAPIALTDTTTTEAYNTYFDVKTVGASMAYQINDRTTLRARTSFDDRDFSARYYYTSLGSDKSTEHVRNWYNRIQLATIGDRSTTDVNLAYKYLTDRFTFSPDFASTNNHVTQYYNFTANHSIAYSDEVTLKFGTQLDNREIESNDRGNHSDFHAGVYGLAKYTKQNLNLILNFRGDYDDNYDFQFSPSLNVSYALPDIVLRASAGRSIRAADYTERYVSNNLFNLTPGRSLGNPDLMSESSWSGELGADYSGITGLRLYVTGFARKSSNLIDYVVTNQSEIGSVSGTGSLREGADYRFAKNISDVTTVGFEAIATKDVNVGPKADLDISVGYTYANTTNDADVVSVYLSNHAKHLLTGNLIFDVKHFGLTFSTVYKQRPMRVSANELFTLDSEYVVCNAQARFKITPVVSLTLDVRNLFDVDYQNIIGAPMPKRWLKGGVAWRF